MKAVVQRVKRARVIVEDQIISEMGPGLLTLLGVARGDTEENLEKIISKILDLRIFSDQDGKMNLSLKETGGQHLIVSQFTLLGDCRQGRRPSFIEAEAPERARDLYEKALERSRAAGVTTFGGRFQAHMEVELTNDGPVTLLLEF